MRCYPTSETSGDHSYDRKSAPGLLELSASGKKSPGLPKLAVR
jgi:hypothetical protein